MKPAKQQKRDRPKKVEESLSYSVEVRDKEGRVLQRISAPSRSYVQAWNQILSVQARHVATGGFKDTGGTARACDPDNNSLNCYTPASGIAMGIRVGKGTTAVAIDDYALETPLGEGTGTDEFEHQAMTRTLPSVAGSTCSFTIKRIINNGSGATITGIKEIGTYVKFGLGYYALGFRDVLPSAVSVPDGGSITVTYTIAVTV